MEELPSWIQQVGLLAVAVASAIVGVWKYIKTDSKPKGGEEIAASFVESKLLRDVIDSIGVHSEEVARVSSKIIRSHNGLREEIVALTEAIEAHTEAILRRDKYV